MKAVILLSGGLDSATTAAVARSQGFGLYALTFDYNQRHKKELSCAQKIGHSLSVQDHQFIELHLPKLNSALIDTSIPIPKGHIRQTIPETYVPARNLIFLSIAAAYAESIGAIDIFVGVNAIDYSGYPDCRPEFIEAFQTALNTGTKVAIMGKPFDIQTPLINLTKGEIIRWGISLGVDYSLTWSCYQGGEKACGECGSCMLRQRGFQEAGINDPLEYCHVP
ncbi:MAG: 7-cyano-7-deazaguanine synthase QueC [Chloroflexota bacterium]|nr:7-cyano-7-deazaguanine synthase QueC [Chloroflexota bacterium]